MAKRKTKKDDKKKFEYTSEVVGIIMILASIIGIGGYGPAGNFIRAFSIFLVGNIYIFLLVAILILGGYIIIKRKSPDLLGLRWIGLYILIISFLILLHLKYIELNSSDGIKIITETYNKTKPFYLIYLCMIIIIYTTEKIIFILIQLRMESIPF